MNIHVALGALGGVIAGAFVTWLIAMHAIDHLEEQLAEYRAGYRYYRQAFLEATEREDARG